MATRLDDIQPLDLASIRDDAAERPPWTSRATGSIALAIIAVVIVVVAALVGDRVPLGPGRPLAIVLVAAWALAAVFVAVQRPRERLAAVMALAAFVGALALFGAALAGRDVATATVRDFGSGLRGVALALFPAVGLHLVLGVPDGALVARARRAWVLAGYVASAAVAIWLVSERPDIDVGPIVAVVAADALVGFIGYVARYRAAGSVQERARLQWPAWSVVVAGAISLGAWVLHELLSWPDDLRTVVLATTVLIPLSLALGASERLSVRIDRLLVHTITLAGLAAMVAASYLLVVLGLGRAPTGDEKTLLGLSMLAAAIAALLWIPVRERLTEFATRRVYGERHAPDEVIRTFGSRLTRALPLDELLLQLAESLKKTMALSVAEVWTRGAGGRLERSVSVPDRGVATMALGAEEEVVVARAGVSGLAWASIWLPQLITADEEVLRVAPITNTGELLGMIIVRRPQGAVPFDENDDQALTELARQVGLALHNVKLDSALQESLDEVQRQADELRASRARIVEAGDSQRRRIERDLHDGAQQHLVALAVSVNLVRQIADSDPDSAKAMLEQMGKDLQEAVQELRNLAHGIYPPLLMDRGLAEALSAAAGRAALPTGVEADGIDRYPQLVEAAVYFCCLEALQNAAKHAGDGAQAMVKVWEDESALLFEVRDDGAGFDLATGAHEGHGFVNMGDRVGAIGGTISVESAPGQGTAIRGRIPLVGMSADATAG
ncbi:MAG TPA: histidine kinase [Acidimicrobiia bacterium]